MPIVVAILLATVAASAPAVEPDAPERPTMRSLGDGAGGPPSRRELVDARRELKSRFREPLSHTETAAGAMLAAEVLFTASVEEEDRVLKWLMLDEARQLALAAGDAEAVSRAINLASAVYEFDAIDTELRSLAEIPLRGIDAGRASRLARVAENLAIRAETDGRTALAVSAQTLAIRGWQRVGDTPNARRASVRLKELEALRQSQ
jgi:hypothetical protein